MNSEELKSFISKFPCLLCHFKGIYFIDQLPKFIKKGDFIICNTDTHEGKGKHWIAFVSLSNFVEVFDSLGVDSEKKTLLSNYCRFKSKKEIIYNETTFQRNDSDTCGKFVVFFLIQRYFNLDIEFEDLLKEIFLKDLDKNENLVINFYDDYGKSNQPSS